MAKVDSVIDMALLGALPPRGSQQAGPARDGGAAAVKVVITNYPPRARARSWKRSTTPKTRRWARARSPSRASFGSSRTISARIRPRAISAFRPARKCGCARATLSRAPSIVKDSATGEVVELHCSYDPATRGGNAPDGRKVKGTIHWVSAQHAIEAEVRLYDALFTASDPSDVPEGADYKMNLNPNSLEVLPAATSNLAWLRRRSATDFSSSD